MATSIKNKKKPVPLASVLKPRQPNDALYLYGISQPAKQFISLKMLGIDGEHGVEALPCGKFIGWVTPVSATEFAQDLNQQMENLEWLAEASVRHQRVVAAIAEKTPLLPTRFGTIFLSEGSLVKDVESRAQRLATSFKRIHESDEWGVKVFLTTQPQFTRVEATSGTDYLRKKAIAVASSSKPAPDDAIKALNSELQKITTVSTSSNKVSSGQQGLQWQASFLLPRKNRKRWDSILKKYATKWSDSRKIEASGPWPPYSFVE